MSTTSVEQKEWESGPDYFIEEVFNKVYLKLSLGWSPTEGVWTGKTKHIFFSTSCLSLCKHLTQLKEREEGEAE